MSIVRVANLAGVSKSTVSRVINDSGDVAPERARAVQQAMRSIGYTPPMRRRGPKPLSRRGIRTGNIAMLVMGMCPADLYRLPVFPSLLNGIERALADQRLNLILANLAQQENLPAAVSGKQADGLLLWGKWDAMPQAVRAMLRELPAVWVMREHSDSAGQFDHVFYNNESIGPMAARYLLRRGHTRLAFANLLPHHTAFAQRQADFAQTARAAGAKVLELIGAPQEREGAEHESAAALIDRMISSSAAFPLGMFVTADAQVNAMHHALVSRGIHPGRDVEIISCDNDRQVLASLSPRPATIDINLELVGRRAVQQLLWRMRNSDESNRISVLVEPTLVPPSE